MLFYTVNEEPIEESYNNSGFAFERAQYGPSTSTEFAEYVSKPRLYTNCYSNHHLRSDILERH